MAYTDSQWKDLLTAVGTQTITYDAIGNPTNYYDGSTMAWAEGRRLQSVTQNGQTHSYQYNADGLRIKKTNPDGTYTVYHIAGGRYLGEIYYTAAGIIDLYTRYNYEESGSVEESIVGVACKLNCLIVINRAHRQRVPFL